MIVPLFVELCAGTAALSLRLHHAHARPPVSRMGAKTGYADVILRILGLRPGQGSADRTRYLWCEPDAGVRLLLEALRDKELALAAAEIIRGWRDEDPKALWTRLKDEGPVVAPSVDPREVARWSWIAQRAYRQGEPQSGGPVQIGDGGRWAQPLEESLAGIPTLPATITDDARTVKPREVARWLQIFASNELINVDSQTWRNTGKGGSTFGGAIGYGADRMLRKLEAAPTLPATITDDARTVEPREVARWCVHWGWRTGGGGAFYAGPNRPTGGGLTLPGLNDRLIDAPTLPATITDDARTVEPPTLPAGTCCFIDPPYVGTTGYQHDLGRPEVVALARKWAEAGAFVAISEAEPIAALVAEGWSTVEITGERKGQKRTFSKQQREWLTLSRAPRWRPSVQGSLFG